MRSCHCSCARSLSTEQPEREDLLTPSELSIIPDATAAASGMSSKSTTSSRSSGPATEDRPLIVVLPKHSNAGSATTTLHVSSNDGEAREWPCAACGCLLGVLHLSLGIGLLLFDILTNSISQTAFAITASLTYLICALLCFIAVRRLDRCAQVLLLCFASFSAVASLSIFLESSVHLNARCSDNAPSVMITPTDDETRVVEMSSENELLLGPEASTMAPPLVACDVSSHAVLTSLIGIALTEFVVCLVTLIVCFRSLHAAYGVPSATSPYSTLIVGDLRTLERQPRLLKATTA